MDKHHRSPWQHCRQEVVILLYCAVALFYGCALISYHPQDAGYLHTASQLDIHNLGGGYGAWLAEFMLVWWGYSAYILAIAMMTMVGYRLYDLIQSLRHQQHLQHHMTMMHGLGLLFVMLSSSALATLYLPVPAHWPISAGGWIGYMEADFFLRHFALVGTTIIQCGYFLVGWVMLTSGSLFQSMIRQYDYIVRMSQQLWAKIRQKRASSARAKTPQPAKPMRVKAASTTPAASTVSQATLKKPQQVKQEKLLKNAPIPLDLLEKEVNKPHELNDEALHQLAALVEQKFKEYQVEVKVTAIHPGPVVTCFELQLPPGTKVSSVTMLSKDIARSLSLVSVRIVEVIAGKSVIGLEIPNKQRETVRLQALLLADSYSRSEAVIKLALGKDVSGQAITVDLAKMPHLLVAGTTGSGKSVGINTMLLSMLYSNTAEQLKLLLIDPKMLELAEYDGIPHLLAPVITDMKMASSALKWCVQEMDRRYQLMAKVGVRNLVSYNSKIETAIARGEPLMDEDIPHESLPHIVVVADEFADMMMMVGKQVEQYIARLAQKARASGIHLILATQRPSVDVITGLIKANIPSRIAFQVSSKIDSRTIIDQMGAEQLLGQGDMLYLPPGGGVPVRIHGAYVTDQEIHNVLSFIKSQGGPQGNILDFSEESQEGMEALSDGDALDPLFNEAVAFIKQSGRVTVSSIQRRFKIGFNRAANIVDQMENIGIVSAMGENGTRTLLDRKDKES